MQVLHLWVEESTCRSRKLQTDTQFSKKVYCKAKWSTALRSSTEIEHKRKNTAKFCEGHKVDLPYRKVSFKMGPVSVARFTSNLSSQVFARLLVSPFFLKNLMLSSQIWETKVANRLETMWLFFWWILSCVYWFLRIFWIGYVYSSVV